MENPNVKWMMKWGSPKNFGKPPYIYISILVQCDRKNVPFNTSYWLPFSSRSATLPPVLLPWDP